MIEALEYPFFQRALIAGVLASVAAGIVGTYVVVRGMSSISGGLSHAAFGGVGIGYAAGFSPVLGAAGFALLAGAAIGIAYRRLRSGFDTLIAMVWSIGMALGIVLVALTPGYAPDLITYLFGSVLFVPPEYLKWAALLDAGILIVVLVFFKELRAVSFDEEFAEVRRVPVDVMLQVLLALVSLAVVTLIRIVGVILAIALFTIPAATARQWSESLGTMMALACAIGAACTTGGLFLAYALSDGFGLSVPTGPLIILLAAAVFGVSSLLRRGRG